MQSVPSPALARPRVTSEAQRPPAKRRILSTSVSYVHGTPRDNRFAAQVHLPVLSTDHVETAVNNLVVHPMSRSSAEGRKAPRQRAPLSSRMFEPDNSIPSSSRPNDKAKAPLAEPPTFVRPRASSIRPTLPRGHRAPQPPVVRQRAPTRKRSITLPGDSPRNARPPLIRRRSPLAPPNSSPAVVIPQKDVVGHASTYPLVGQPPTRTRKGSARPSKRQRQESLVVQVFKRPRMMTTNAI
jgi:hypothetical protein